MTKQKSIRSTFHNSFFGLILLSSLLIFNACTEKSQPQNSENQTENQTEEIIDEVPTESATEVGLNFINGYVDNANKMYEAKETTEWVEANNLVTENFKTTLAKMLQEANEKDPEYGLGVDPIFNAQDYPDKGFVLLSYDSISNFLEVQGKNSPAFNVTIKMVKENNKWLVDGCGIINIPADKNSNT